MKGLTPRQVEFLSFLRAHQAERGFNPSYDEIAAALGTRKSSIARMVDELEARGVIHRRPKRNRCLEIVEDTGRLTGQPATVFSTFSKSDVRLPLRLSEEDKGVVLDRDGRDVFTVDVNGERCDAQVEAICAAIIRTVNAAAGFASAKENRP